MAEALQSVPLPLGFGEPAPWFIGETETNPRFQFDTVAGRWIVLMLFGTLGTEPTRAAHDLAMSRRDLFDDQRAAFFGVSVDVVDWTVRGMAPSLPGVRYFRDPSRTVSRQFGAVTEDGRYRPLVLLLDSMLRVVACDSILETAAVLAELDRRLDDEWAGTEQQFAPVLTLPRVFEPAFCERLIDYYETIGGEPSGFMRQEGERTVGVHDPSFKRRLDVTLTDEPLMAGVRARIQRRLAPVIQRAYGWNPTRLERYLVACYDADEGGFFRAHRDNTTVGTAHRRLAVTINLNADDYDGGELRFPEFGRRTYKPPTGGATVFGCGLLHEATPVTRGRRYAFLPFLYDDAAAVIRERNQGAIVPAEAAA